MSAAAQGPGPGPHSSHDERSKWLRLKQMTERSGGLASFDRARPVGYIAAGPEPARQPVLSGRRWAESGAPCN
jgi:hypothetical protein